MLNEKANEMVKKAIEKANEMAYSDYHINLGTERQAGTKLWENEENSRTYIKIHCKTLNGKYKGAYDCGYIDNNTGEYVFTDKSEVNLGL